MANAREKVLVLDDNPDNANFICKILKENGFHPMDANTIEDAKEKLDKNQVDILVFDIGLDVHDLRKTSIELAIEANKSKPRPTLFYTHYDQTEAPEFFEKTRQIEHSLWSNQKGENWQVNILNNIALAKEFFKYYQLMNEPNMAEKIKFKNLISFKEWRGRGIDRDEMTARRVFLKKDEILFITSDRSRLLFKEAFEPSSTNYSVICTKNMKYYRVGAKIGDIEDQLDRYYKIGWNFIRIHNSYIINVDYLKEFNTQEMTIFLNELEFHIPATETFFKDSIVMDLFAILVSSNKENTG